MTLSNNTYSFVIFNIVYYTFGLTQICQQLFWASDVCWLSVHLCGSIIFDYDLQRFNYNYKPTFSPLYFMSELDNTLKHNRKKQIIYWNINTLSNLHSLSQAILHQPYPQLHTQSDRDWSYLHFLKQVYNNGKQKAKTFISQSAKYIDMTKDVAFDRVSLYKSQHYELNVMKNQFWTKLYYLKPITDEGYKCRKIVRTIVWKERAPSLLFVVLFAIVVNAFSGIAKLKFSKRMLTFGVLAVASEAVVRVRKSDLIFYSLPTLPDPQLEAQRQQILRKSLVIDGQIHSYGKTDHFDKNLESVANNQNEDEKKQILEVLGYKIISKADLV